MTDKKLYNPEGMYDLLFDRCRVKKEIEGTIRDIFQSFGFMEIETPSMEFLGVFHSENNIIPEESLFKLFDEKGRILALRPEMTIPAARVAATKLKDMKLPLKISYLGNCYKSDAYGGGKQKEFTQAGVEIMGSPGAFADAFVIVTAIEAIKGTGIMDFTIELGQVEFFKGLMEQAGFREDVAEQIRQIIEKKDFFSLEEMLAGLEMDKAVRESILSLPEYFGGKEMLVRMKEKSLNDRSMKAVDNLIEIFDILDEFDASQAVSVDLGMVSNLSYYTGIIFKGLTYGVGFPLLTGGRYDQLCRGFGRDIPSTGFSLDIDMALTALYRNRSNLESPATDSLVCFCPEERKTGILLAMALRGQDLKVELFSENQDMEYIKAYALERNIPGVVQVESPGGIFIHDLTAGTCSRTDLDKLMKGKGR
ncbi:MAG: ATP phosphoribosyltransferase regulatory subunit [Clostridia bacterium]